jgi:mono/diheme cytochrome c family protein
MERQARPLIPQLPPVNSQPGPTLPPQESPPSLPYEPPKPQEPTTPSDGPTELDKQVYAIFKASCAKCHNESKQSGDFQLVNSANGALVNHPLENRVLIERVVRGVHLKEDGLKLMPLNGQPLPDDQLQSIYLWMNEEARKLRESEPVE